MSEPTTYEYSPEYQIGLCPETDVADLQAFIHAHWKPNHILARHRGLLDWQHYNPCQRCYNFAIARHQATNAIHGIAGFIPTNHFDPAIPVCDLWMAVWRVPEGIRLPPGLGIALYEYVIDLLKPRTQISMGIRKGVMPFYRHYRFNIHLMNHYYIVNPAFTDFHVVGNFDDRYHANVALSDAHKELREYDLTDVAALSAACAEPICANDVAPVKSLTFLANRYGRHPIYNYHGYGIVEQERVLGVLVLRVLNQAGHSVVRIVDYVGPIEALNGTAYAFAQLLEQYQAEYLDWYNFGIDDELMTSLGFLKRASDSPVVIPNYFEPFEPRNVNLDMAYLGDQALKYIMHRGDSDQDRPNFLPPQ